MQSISLKYCGHSRHIYRCAAIPLKIVTDQCLFLQGFTVFLTLAGASPAFQICRYFLCHLFKGDFFCFLQMHQVDKIVSFRSFHRTGNHSRFQIGKSFHKFRPEFIHPDQSDLPAALGIFCIRIGFDDLLKTLGICTFQLFCDLPAGCMGIRPGSAAMAFVRAAADDAYERLIWPSMERETRSMLTDTACEGAIKMFGLNLKPLLMQPPVKGKHTMGLDPGYRNGCKVAVVDGTGKVLDTAVVYPTFNDNKKREAITKLSALIKKHGVEHIAIGNGTASRET